jgi:uncharacterized coiled-coil protein SlyX
MSATEQTILELNHRVGDKRRAMDLRRNQLASVEKQLAGAGAVGRFGRLGRQAALLRREIGRAERSVAPEQNGLAEQRGRLGVLTEKAEQLERAMEDARADECALRHRCESERAKLDALLLAAPSPVETRMNAAGGDN